MSIAALKANSTRCFAPYARRSIVKGQLNKQHLSYVFTIFRGFQDEQRSFLLTERKVKRDFSRLTRTYHFGVKTMDIKYNATLGIESYDLWFQGESFEDTAFYHQYIKKNCLPALELACGTGRLLIPYVKSGLEVHGLDISQTALDICRQKLKNNGLKVDLFCQSMQKMDIPYKYGTIYVPYGSFMLIDDKEEAKNTLKKIFNHLFPKGELLIYLFNPLEHDIHIDAPVSGEWRLRREGIRPNDNALIRCFELSNFDKNNKIQNISIKYEVYQKDKLIELSENKSRLRWYTYEEFYEMLNDTGFKSIKCLKAYSEEVANSNDKEVVFLAMKP